jgi:hypothetical protein
MDNEKILYPFLELLKVFECTNRVMLTVGSLSSTLAAVAHDLLWCSAPSYHDFCTTKTLPVKIVRKLIPLAKVFLLMRGTKAQDSLLKYSKLREFIFFVISIPPPQYKPGNYVSNSAAMHAQEPFYPVN